MCSVYEEQSIAAGLVKASYVSMNGIYLVNLHRTNFECAIAIPEISVELEVIFIVAIAKNKHSFTMFNPASEYVKFFKLLKQLEVCQILAWRRAFQSFCRLSALSMAECKGKTSWTAFSSATGWHRV